MLHLHTPKIRYCISSHVRFKEYCLERLLDSLKEVPRELILVTIGGANTNEVRHEFGVECHYVNYNAFEYSSLINIVENEIVADYWFLLHDTMRCGPEFYRRTGFYRTDADVVTTSKKGFCNLAMFSYAYLRRIRKRITDMKNLTKDRAVDFEGRFYKDAKVKMFRDATVENFGEDDVYNTGIIRRVDYYAAVDVFKYGANGPKNRASKKYVRQP